MRSHVSFVVPMGDHWIARGKPLTLSKERDEALEFTLLVSPTAKESLQIEMACHQLLGGMDAFLDVREAMDQAKARGRAEIVKILWPDGRPEVENEEARQDQEDQIQQTIMDPSYQSRNLDLFLQYSGLLDRVEFMGSWSTLVVNAPAGWSDIANSDQITSAAVSAMLDAYRVASAEYRRGKARPSAS